MLHKHQPAALCQHLIRCCWQQIYACQVEGVALGPSGSPLFVVGLAATAAAPTRYLVSSMSWGWWPDILVTYEHLELFQTVKAMSQGIIVHGIAVLVPLDKSNGSPGTASGIPSWHDGSMASQLGSSLGSCSWLGSSLGVRHYW